MERGKERREKRRQEKKSILGSAQSLDWKHTRAAAAGASQQYALSIRLLATTGASVPYLYRHFVSVSFLYKQERCHC